MAAPDVIVVGAGAIGVACAYEMACRGASVTVVEREGAAGLGCSYGNAGLIGAGTARPLATPTALREGLGSLFKREAPFRLKPRPKAVPWLLRFALACRARTFEAAAAALAPLGEDSFQMHLGYAAAGIEVGLVRRGALLAWETREGLEAGIRGLRAAGRPVTVLEGEKVAELAPGLAAGLAGAALAGDVAHVDSGRWTRAVAQAAEARGARFLAGVSVSRLAASGGRVTGVETGAGPIRAGQTVVAAGVWSDRLLRGAGVSLGLQAGKGYHVDLAPRAEDPELPVYLQEAHVVATPLGRCLRLAGTLDLTGLDGRIERRRTDAILAAAERSLPGVGSRQVEELWAGLRPCTPDGLPAIGHVADVDGLLVATGHAMIGLALAPVTGKLVAELACGAAPSHDLAAFRPDRF